MRFSGGVVSLVVIMAGTIGTILDVIALTNKLKAYRGANVADFVTEAVS